MVLFKFNKNRICVINDEIYIPLWSYSNRYYNVLKKTYPKFTFHYGPIQIPLSDIAWAMQREFTFHYGPIQIKSAEELANEIIRFTFHYGPIQIKLRSFTMHFTKIYIPLWSYSNLSLIFSLNSCISIYIPLWSYSNLKDLISEHTQHNNLHSTMVLFK